MCIYIGMYVHVLSFAWTDDTLFDKNKSAD